MRLQVQICYLIDSSLRMFYKGDEPISFINLLRHSSGAGHVASP